VKDKIYSASAHELRSKFIFNGDVDYKIGAQAKFFSKEPQ
jgi:hypothetical protein